jgi:galactosamine-6-phosphate isomerase
MKSVAKSSNLRIEIAADYEGMSRAAVAVIIAELRKKPDLVLCASAGGTPTRTYELLGKLYARQPQLFRRLRILQIDEWGGIPSEHPASCRSDLLHKLVEPLKVPRRNFVSFSSENPKPLLEVERITKWLERNGPIDLCILGLGTNGHIAMNEPGDTLLPYAHVAELAPSSLRHEMLKDLRPKPYYGLTIGMADIFTSRKLLLLVSGKAKQSAVTTLLAARVSTRFPASFVWLHPHATLISDRQAMAKVRSKDRSG